MAPRHLQPPSRTTDTRPATPFAWAKEIGSIFVAALALSTILRAFVFQVFWIPSPSMHDTLIENDKIVVSRLAGLTDSIERGDIVVFHDELGWISASSSSANPLYTLGEFLGLLPGGGDQTLVKRVIAVGGDRVSCGDDGIIHVNGVALNEPYVSGGQVPSSIPFDVTVPEGSLWVMGDNRANSADSRYHMGVGQTPFVPVSSVVGTVSAIIWPLDRFAWGLSANEVFSGVDR